MCIVIYDKRNLISTYQTSYIFLIILTDILPQEIVSLSYQSLISLSSITRIIRETWELPGSVYIQLYCHNVTQTTKKKSQTTSKIDGNSLTVLVQLLESTLSFK